MSSERKVKCPTCSTLNSKSETIEHQKRYYCKACYELKTAPKQKSEWDYLYDTIVHYYGRVTPIMFKQLKDYREKPQYRFTDSGMRLTLNYYHNVLGKPVLQDADTLGIIVYYYEQARTYYKELFRLQQVSDVFTHNESSKVVKVSNNVSINTKQRFDFDCIKWEVSTVE